MKKQGVGPAAYFPSIVATYGRSIAEWKALMRASGFVTYKDLVAWLKQEHGFGHGHANAITIHLLNESKPHLSRADRVATLFPASKAHWRPVYDAVLEEISTFGEVTIVPKQTSVGIATRWQFVILQPATPRRFDIDLKLPGAEPTDRLKLLTDAGTPMTHRVSLTDPAQVDEELFGWLRRAWVVSLQA